MTALKGFDPRTTPWTLPSANWSPIAPKDLMADRLKWIFKNPPEWSPEVKREHAWEERTPKAAAVLIPIVLRADEGHVLLTQRTQHLTSHGGQIAFPGGKVDDDDASVEDAALREAKEEVGLSPEFVEVLGRMPSYVTGSGFHITPVVGLVSPHMQITPNPEEVDEVFEVPLSFLMNPANHRFHEMEREGVMRRWYSMLYMDTHTAGPSQPTERFIWGVTAGMLRNFYRLLLAANSL
jgi:8-oxo-dGTP pyrophosphatase MutT (NUDIX family)